VVELSNTDSVVAVLLHPRLSPNERAEWVDAQAGRHSDWRLAEVSPDELARRLAEWFPYLEDVLDREGETMLPAMVEITTREPAAVVGLRGAPEVLAVGPTASVQRSVGLVARRLALVLLAVAVALAAGAALLAAVWVHLELHRHSEEIAIMRLMGATEAMVRGPFLLAVTVPGIVAATVAVAATALSVAEMARLAAPLGIAVAGVSPWVLVGEVAGAVGLPLLAGLITLTRHASEMDG
jgi:cell division transport system permease protein